MLSYLGTGKRWYGERPVRAAQRNAWEFQAVVQGRIGVLWPQGPDILRKQHLWLFPPETAHGWNGEPNRPAEVIVFQFPYVPETVEKVARQHSYVELALSGRQCDRLRELAAQAERYWHHPAPGMMLCYHHVLLELSMLIQESTTLLPGISMPTRAECRVEAAIKWYAKNLENCPTLEAVAGETGTSPAHLRRMFRDVLQTSPKQIFDQIRFERALQLMTNTDLKLEAVGQRCGFGSGSSFSRAFKAKFGCSPEVWRG